MLTGPRLATGALLVAAVVLAAATIVMPARINLRTYTIPCPTPVFPQRHDEIVAALCERAEAYKLRATLAIAALLAALAILPLVLSDTRSRLIWAAAFVVVMAGTLTILGVVGTRHMTLFFDL